MTKKLTNSEIEELKQTFDLFDSDGNGALSRDEIANVLRSLGMNLNDQELESIFISIDKNSSNAIDFSSFSRWMADKVDITSKKKLLEIFNLIDVDGSGTISIAEIRQLLDALNIDILDHEIEAMIQNHDTDQNGLIDYDEFVKSKGLWTRIKLTLGTIRSFYTQAEFDSLAREYNQLIRLWVPWYDEIIAMTVGNLPDRPSQPCVLDLGGGTGNLSATLIEKYPQAEIHIVDFSSKMIDFCQQRFVNNDRVQVYEQDFMTLDFEEAAFDHVISQITLHHLEDANKKQLFQNVHKWLKPGGTLSYSDIFRGINNDVHDRYNSQWKTACYELGASDEQWNHFWDHDQRYDRHIPIVDVVNWLQEIGFKEIDITWRHSLWANMVARKA